MSNLTAEDLNQHQALGIPPELLDQAGVERVTDTEARAWLSSRHPGDLAGVVYPYRDPATGAPQTCRVRRDHPEIEHGKPRDKYLSAFGDSKRLFFPPDSGELLADTSAPIVFVEAEKSVLAIMAAAERTGRRVLAIGTGGCWGWRGRIGKTTDATGARVDEKGPLPDLTRVVWPHRDVVIVFDANAAANTSVQAARRALSKDLTDRGAHVRLAELPIEDGINGPDDYVGTHGDAALFTLLDAAKPARPSQDRPITDLLSELQLTAEAVRDITADVLGERLRALAAALTGADPLRRALVATELKKTAKIPATIVTAALGTRDDETEKQTANTITLTDDKPWPEPVNGAALLAETAAFIRRHVVLSEPQADAIALWAAAAHAIDGLQRMPMLLFSSSAPECGKTTAATMMSGIVPRPIMVSSLTPAVLFRVIDKHRPTLIADEVDSWLSDEKSELRGVFNASHWRTGAVIPRCVGDDNEVQLFNVFGAKVIAMIGRPSATMLSRCLTITLRRKTADERAEPLREDRLRADLAPLRQQWRRWVMDHLDALRSHEPTMPGGLPVNRASDNWRPLLSVADLAGGEWPARGRAAALALSGVRVNEDEPVNVMLLSDVRVVFDGGLSDAYLSSEEIVAALKMLPERPWTDWNKGRGISASQLASRLRDFGSGPLGLRTRETRIGDKTGKRWHREDFVDAWSRYVTADPQHPQQTNESGPPPVISNPQQSTDVAGLKVPVQPMFTGLVAGVAAAGPDRGAGRASSREGEWLDL